jgi:hypothetical protein
MSLCPNHRQITEQITAKLPPNYRQITEFSKEKAKLPNS